jgi:uncharacterized protein
MGFAYEYGKSVEQSDEEAMRCYRLAANQGHTHAQFCMGLAYEKGKSVEQSDKEALRWYRLILTSRRFRQKKSLQTKATTMMSACQ